MDDRTCRSEPTGNAVVHDRRDAAVRPTPGIVAGRGGDLDDGQAMVTARQAGVPDPTLEPLRPPTNEATKPAQERSGRLWQALLPYAAGAGAALLLLMVLERIPGMTATLEGLGLLDLLLIVPALLVVGFLVVLVHEAGHALAGSLAGFTLIAFVVGPLRLVRLDGRLRPSFNRDPALYGGITLSVPAAWRGIDRFRRGFVWSIAGGPLASLLAGAAAIAAGTVWADGLVGWLRATLIAAGTLSLLIGFVNLVPASLPSGFRTDGAHIMLAATRGRPAHILLTALSSLALLHRPSMWDRQLVEGALAADAQGGDGRISLSAFYWALDRWDLDSARKLLQRALDHSRGWTPVERAALAAEAALFEACVRRDPAAGRRWLETNPLARVADPWTHRLAAAAIRSAEGDAAGAARSLDAARRALRRSLTPDIWRAHTATLERLESDVGRPS